MMQGLQITLQAPLEPGLGARFVVPPALPLEALLCGRAPAQVADLLPRLFNLCGAAQGLAARLALGLPAGDLAQEAPREILRDHLAKLFVHWPRLLGLAPRALPAQWRAGHRDDIARALWGVEAAPRDLAAFLQSSCGIAPVLRAIAAAFAPGEGVADLPPLGDPLVIGAQDNSPATRNGSDPLLAQARASYGPGPLWRALARAVDALAMLDGGFAPRVIAPGAAVVPAARGSYALRLEQSEGRVSTLCRVTPTDHLLAPGGVLQASLASLPAGRCDRVALLVDILDPCVPYHVSETAHA